MKRLHDWLFAPARPSALGVCRIIFFVVVLLATWKMNYAEWANVPSDWFRPTVTWKLLKLRILDYDTINAMQIVFRIALVSSAIGLLTPLSIAASLVTGFYLLSMPGNFGKGNHGEAILALTMLILLFSRCGDALSIDAIIRKRLGKSRSIPSGEYRWPIVLARVVLVCAFTAAGITKLRIAGLEWVTTDHFRHLMLEHLTATNHPPLESLTRWFAKHALLCHLIAGSVIATQLAAPLSLLHRKLAAVVMTLLLLMQVSIGLLLGVWFVSFLAMYVFWLPWFWKCGGATENTEGTERLAANLHE